MFNAIVGSSIFGLPSVVAVRLGAASVWGWILTALAIGLVLACFAEVASRFEGAGGPYRYASAAFGRLAGIEVGWLFYLVRITATATNANLFVILLGLLWPGATGPVASRIVLALLIVPLAVINYLGVKGGATLSSVLVILKGVPLLLFIGAGLIYLSSHAAVPAARMHPGPSDYLDAVLLLGFAYGGFEAALVPLAEAVNPRRDAPFALFVALGSCAVLYGLAQVVVTGTVTNPASVSRPLAEAARVIAGTPGAIFMTIAALISIAGYMAGTMVNVPRITWAMADSGDLPRWLARVHPRFRTPTASLLLYAALAWSVAASGTFLSNLSLSAGSRVWIYAVVCAALPVFRARERRGDPSTGSARFVLPGGTVVACLGIAVLALLATRIGARELMVTAGTLGFGLLNWLWVRHDRAAMSPNA